MSKMSPYGGGGGGRVSIFVLNIMTGNMQQATHTVNGIKKKQKKKRSTFWRQKTYVKR